MNTGLEAKKYLNKYFKSQFINENDDEFKALVKLLNQAKVVKNCNIPPVSNHVNCEHVKGRRTSVLSDKWKCAKCGEIFDGN